MADHHNDSNNEAGLPPRRQVHGKKRKRQKNRGHGSSDSGQKTSIEQTSLVEEDTLQDSREEEDHRRYEDESAAYPLYRRPERKKNDYFLVKVWLVLFLLIVIGMVTYPFWQQWL